MNVLQLPLNLAGSDVGFWMSARRLEYLAASRPLHWRLVSHVCMTTLIGHRRRHHGGPADFLRVPLIAQVVLAGLTAKPLSPFVVLAPPSSSSRVVWNLSEARGRNAGRGRAQQGNAALSAVADWLGRGTPQVFRLFGYAGTGKTTLAKHLAENVDGDVVFGAFTGKAASVLRAKGCHDASTIHSMIYRSKESDEGGPLFALNRSGPAAKADLIVIDECSMVDQDLGRDLLSFGKPVLVLGDPAQLPPVKGGGFFTMPSRT
jgi:hypothetical protein